MDKTTADPKLSRTPHRHQLEILKSAFRVSQQNNNDNNKDNETKFEKVDNTSVHYSVIASSHSNWKRGEHLVAKLFEKWTNYPIDTKSSSPCVNEE
ncbi:unnamed protein product [Trichobilharzia regenti]|nr:unnamed protein product [Trichobilharzia regenti]